jgi:AcrR family transcriptional regulator
MTARNVAAAKRQPTQERSRARFESILAAAVAVMTENGPEAFRMSDIVARTGIGFGSLYQYFPDKAAVIATLAERTNAAGRDCVRRELAALRKPADLHPVLCRITDSYYRFFQDDPAVRCVWQATQGDRALQRIDAEDGAYLASLLADALQPLAPRRPAAARAEFAELVMVLIAAAVRHAVLLPPARARRLLSRFKQTLPRTID